MKRRRILGFQERVAKLSPAPFSGVRIPLAPTLSRRERENRRQSVGETNVFGMAENPPLWLPLPPGEGWGEGNSCGELSPQSGFALACRISLFLRLSDFRPLAFDYRVDEALV